MSDNYARAPSGICLCLVLEICILHKDGSHKETISIIPHNKDWTFIAARVRKQAKSKLVVSTFLLYDSGMLRHRTEKSTRLSHRRSVQQVPLFVEPADGCVISSQQHDAVHL